MFDLLKSHMGRNMMILEKSSSFCAALPNILKAEIERLNIQKDVKENWLSLLVISFMIFFGCNLKTNM